MSINQWLPGVGGNLRVGLHAAVAANMKHCAAMLDENAADQQPPMAMGRVFLAADQRDPEALHACLETRNGGPEPGILAKAAINNVSIGVVVGRIGRASP